ncbi:ATP12 chaperone protein [Roseovarius albus]|uniref:ATP12 chaperone protein n=1 Tax=Roseovarius albus TaxID=1247867 RepID=A0A1X7A5F6_9RHOB|nr:ATP12 family protein [Roseovarius albus]SLN71088.1 ATP12 chaperone protein [Roseovarius albus]
MSAWKAKRFWEKAEAVETEGGFSVELDGRSVKTPAKAALIVPSRALADAIAVEWDAQQGEINPNIMPVTRAANAAIDKVTHQHAEVADLIAAYGDADLTCYRADNPVELVERQALAWDPLLDWTNDTFGVRLLPVSGVMHAPQNPQSLKLLSDHVHAMDAFTLTAFHDLVGLSGSLVIGLAALKDHRRVEDLWQLSRIDETWQAEQWGVDEEAQEQAALKESAFVAAKNFHNLARASE